MEFTDENGADATITFTITNNAEAGSDEYLGVTVNTTTGTQNNATVVTSPSGATKLAPGESQVYTITFHILDAKINASITDFATEFNLELTTPPSLKYDSEKDYYYVTMGTTIKGEEIRWKYVGYVAEDGTLTASTTPTTGQQGIFYQETLVPLTSSSDTMSYQNNFILDLNSMDDTASPEYAHITGYDDVLANDYSMSNIRAFLNGNIVKRYYTLSSASKIYTYTPSGNEISLASAYNIPSDDAVYNAIIGRSLSDLYKNMGWISSTGEISNVALPTQSNGSETDKLWLLSAEEVLTLIGGQTVVDGVIEWPSDYSRLAWNSSSYWLRAPDPEYASHAYYAEIDGAWSYYNIIAPHAVRAAFILEI